MILMTLKIIYYITLCKYVFTTANYINSTIGTINFTFLLVSLKKVFILKVEVSLYTFFNVHYTTLFSLFIPQTVSKHAIANI